MRKYERMSKIAWLTEGFAEKMDDFMLNGSDAKCSVSFDKRQELFEEYKKIPALIKPMTKLVGADSLRCKYTVETLSDYLHIAGITLNDFLEEVGLQPFALSEREEEFKNRLLLLEQDDPRLEEYLHWLDYMVSDFWSLPRINEMTPTYKLVAFYDRFYYAQEKAAVLEEILAVTTDFRKCLSDSNGGCRVKDEDIFTLASMMDVPLRWLYRLHGRATAFTLKKTVDMALNEYMMLQPQGREIAERVAKKLFDSV